MQSKKISENSIIMILCGLFFFHIVEFMILMPLGPQLMRVLHISAGQFSSLVAVYNFAAAASGVLGLFWMDRWDRKRMLIVVNVLFAGGTAICFMTTNYTSLLLARMITGGFGGIIGALCMTIIGDIVPFERRGFAMSKLMSSFSLASIAGIPLGLSIAHHFSWQAPFIFITGGSLIFCIIAFFKMPPLTGHLNTANSTSLRDFVDIAIDARHLKCFFFMMLLMFSQFTIIPFISTALVKNGGMLESQLPFVYLFGGIATAFSNPLIGRLSDIYSKQSIFKICAFIAWIPLFLITNQGPSSLLYSLIITTMFFIFNSGRMSPAMAIITSVVSPEKRGRFMSLNSAVQQSCSGLAAGLGGLLVSSSENGHLNGLAYTGYISIAVNLISIFWVTKLDLKTDSQSALQKNLD